MLQKVGFRNAVLVGIALAFVVLLMALHDVVGPILIALAVAYVFDPVIDQLERWRISRSWGIVIVLVIVCLIVTGFALYMIPKLVEQIQELAHKLPVYLDRLRELWPELKGYREQYADEFEKVLTWLETQAKTHGATLLKSLSASLASSFVSLGSFLASLVGLVIIPVLAFYLLRDFDVIKEKAVLLIPVKRREWTLGLFGELDRALGGFIKGQLTVALILAVIYSVGLFLCRCPASFLIGTIAGFANLVPYLGIAVGFLPAVLLTYLAGNPMGFVIGAGLTFIVGQMLEGLLITPKVVGESVGLHPVVVLIALMIGGTYFGMVGMILALPVSAVLMVVARRAYRAYTKSILYHEEDAADSELDSGPEPVADDESDQSGEPPQTGGAPE